MPRPPLRGAPRVLVTFALALALASLLPILAALAFAQEVPEADATVRVVHASPGAPDVDVLLDGQPLLEGLASDSASVYLPITAEEHRLQIIPSGQTAESALVDETIDAAPGRAYLLAVFGLLNNVGGAVYDVDLSEIEPGNARVRFINFSPDAGALDLLETGGDEWFGNVGLGEVSDYRDMAPGAYSADLRAEDDRIVRTVDDLTFNQTRVYDVIALGQLADDSLHLQTLETMVSPPCAEVLGLEASGSDACVRVVHAAPDAPGIDFYLNEAQIAGGLEFGTATEYTAVPSGDGRNVTIVASGGPAEEAILETGLDFEQGQAYEILITGPGEELNLTITGTDLRPVAAGQARLRVVHTGVDAGAVDVGLEGDEEVLYGGVDFAEATEYIILDAGDYPLEVRPGGEDMTVALQSNITLEEAMVYDLVLLGRPADQSLTLLVLTAPVAIQTGDIATPETVTNDATIAETVAPATLENDPSATPAN